MGIVPLPDEGVTLYNDPVDRHAFIGVIHGEKVTARLFTLDSGNLGLKLENGGNFEYQPADRKAGDA